MGILLPDLKSFLIFIVEEKRKSKIKLASLYLLCLFLQIGLFILLGFLFKSKLWSVGLLIGINILVAGLYLLSHKIKIRGIEPIGFKISKWQRIVFSISFIEQNYKTLQDYLRRDWLVSEENRVKVLVTTIKSDLARAGAGLKFDLIKAMKEDEKLLNS